MKRPGLRAAFPGGYAIRSAEAKRTSLLTAAFIAPSMFENGFVRVHVFPVKPATRRAWDCTVVLEFPIDLKADESAERQFAVFVRNGARKVLGFNRRITVKAKHTTGGMRRVSFSQPVELGPGTYTVTAVVGDPARDSPYASSAQVVVPPLPDGDAFLVPPVFGRQAMGDVVVQAIADDGTRKTSDELARNDRVGDLGSFMPLLVQSVKPDDRVLAMTRACVRPRRNGGPLGSVSRALDAESGDVAFQWESALVDLDAQEGVVCRPLLDPLPVSSLPPGDYVFRASLETGGGHDTRVHRVSFRLEAPAGP